MAKSTTQTQTEGQQANARIFAQGTGESELSSPGGHEPGVSTNDALMSPFPSVAPAQQAEHTTGSNSSPRPRYYSQGQNGGTAPQQTGGVQGQTDQITSSQTSQYPAFNPEERGGSLNNQWSNPSAPPNASQHGQASASTDEKAGYHQMQQANPAPSQVAPQAQPQTARERFHAKKPEPSQQGNNPQNIGANGVPRPVNNLVIPLDGLRDSQGQVDCPRCRQQVVTRVARVTGTTATTWSVILCLLTGICCAWIPCVIDDCKDSEHYCFNCGLHLATYTAGGHSHVHAVVKAPGQLAQGQNQPAQQPAAGTKEMPRDMSGQQYNQQQQMQYTSQLGSAQQVEGRPLGQNSYVGPPLEVHGSPVEHQYTNQTTGVTTDNVEMPSNSEKRLEQSLNENEAENRGD